MKAHEKTAVDLFKAHRGFCLPILTVIFRIAGIAEVCISKP